MLNDYPYRPSWQSVHVPSRRGSGLTDLEPKMAAILAPNNNTACRAAQMHDAYGAGCGPKFLIQIQIYIQIRI